MAHSTLKLFYFDTEGRAEVARIILAAAGKTFQDIRCNEDDWLQQKTRAPYGQVPVLEVDGVAFAQSLAINAFLAREFGFYGNTNLENFKIDEIVHLVNDFMTAATKVLFLTPNQEEQASGTRELKEETGPRMLGFLEKFLRSSGSGYFVGDRLTLADICVLDIVTGSFALLLDVNNSYPLLRKNLELTKAHPKIGAYLISRETRE
ncbi:glutathione S-transferase 1-like [Physella acuta]|uniref:glutathione S-transferase 1-like n=1 Tax=Physella acuta TaxID=109671 RepID=UPI0027DB4107|nr:glutathione S-transferase 1-like [Physella acuta]